MQRRSFLTMAGAAPLVAADAPKKPALWVLENYYLKQGTQPARIHEYLSQGLLPALNKITAGPKIVLESLIAPHTPQVAMLTGYESLAQWNAARAALAGDAAAQKALASWEAGAEAPYEHYTTTLLESAAYAPAVALEPRDKPRIFEVRVYHSPTWRQLKALHERFAGPEIQIFHRVGVHPVLYTSTIAGANMPNLTYVIPFDNLAAREKAWDAFGADPEWVKVRKESIDRNGQISIASQIAIFRATAYSPVR